MKSPADATAQTSADNAPKCIINTPATTVRSDHQLIQATNMQMHRIGMPDTLVIIFTSILTRLAQVKCLRVMVRTNFTVSLRRA